MSEGAVEVTIKYLVSLADKTGKRKETMELDPGATLEDLSRRLNREYGLNLPDPRIMAVLNGKGWEQYPDKLETELRGGDTVMLFPPIAGG
jgi:MoaD family protein